MKGDHALALTAYVVLSLAVVGVSVDRFETNQSTSPRSASGAATPEGSAGVGSRISPGGRDPRTTREESGQAGPDRTTGGDGPTTAAPLPTGVAAPGTVMPGAQPRPPAEVSDSTSTTPVPETSASEPADTDEPADTGDTGSTVPCPGDDSVLVTPVPSGDLCPSPEPAPTPDTLLDDLDPLGSVDRLDLPGLGFRTDADAGSAG